MNYFIILDNAKRQRTSEKSMKVWNYSDLEMFLKAVQDKLDNGYKINDDMLLIKGIILRVQQATTLKIENDSI